MSAPTPSPSGAPSGAHPRMILTNATLVLRDETLAGTLHIRDGHIVSVDPGATRAPGAIDCEGDLLIPGLIELHTDNLERHILPRPGVDWPHAQAMLAHDAELAGCGITTVFDAMRVGSILDGPKLTHREYARALASELLALRARDVLKISHFLHLRAEVCSDTLIEELARFTPEDRVGLVSIMDHTPGQRQFRDFDQYRAYVRGKHGMSEEQFQEHARRLLAKRERIGAAHEAAAVAEARRLGAVLASHDDTLPEHVATSAGHGVRLAEFPTTPEAAQACRDHGIAVMMGAPNVIRGGSHSGNVAASDLAEAGLLDILSSDYVPAALMMAAFRLADLWGDLARGLATVTSAPARVTGLDDRGEIAPGRRADLVRVRRAGGLNVVRSAWVQGRQVA